MKGADQTRRSHSSHYWDEVLVGPTEEGTEREAAAVLVGLPLRTRSDMLQFLEAVGYLERSNESGIERWAVRALPSRVDDVLDGRWWSVRTALEAEGLTPR